jgi:hypothetical protein
LDDWMAEALKLVQTSRMLSKNSQSRKLAQATTQVLEAMASDGLIAAVELDLYSSVMTEMIKSGALKIESTAEVLPIRCRR